MQGYIRGAKKLGAEYLYEDVEMILSEQDAITGVRVADGREYHAPIVINCAGAWAPKLSEKMGLPLPVVPLP
ncbi:FAD-dependent oxidoreductase, partial [Microbacteriaceae bacterium K1510]|nr:FAD-dependent oxidoreductase [Microbacteriaceae bacterium K1510]